MHERALFKNSKNFPYSYAFLAFFCFGLPFLEESVPLSSCPKIWSEISKILIHVHALAQCMGTPILSPAQIKKEEAWAGDEKSTLR